MTTCSAVFALEEAFMGLPDAPVIKKFFANKIESSVSSWGDYLLEVADIFSMFDGEELDRELIADRFSAISGRSSYRLRDAANFRDEFGAYGTYLGVFHIKKDGQHWRIFLSGAARHFLCSTEPDVESFCRTQLSLFQYPNGAGAVINRNKSVRAQANVRDDTIREIQNNIHLNPMRLLCRTIITMHEYCEVPLEDIIIPYKTIFLLMNDDTINQSYSPPYEAIKAALESYKTSPLPDWARDKVPANFKRNFHIMVRTGIFSRKKQKGLTLSDSNPNQAYEYAKVIASMQCNFDAFEDCYGAANIGSAVERVIESPSWGDYYDALSLPMDVLSALSDDIDFADTDFYVSPLGTVKITEQPFPEMKVFRDDQVKTFTSSGSKINPYETLIRREKANREHTRILSMLAANIRLAGYEVFENTFIDLHTKTDTNTFIFEVKSNSSRNTLSQVRKAVSQLYEYRYRSEMNGAILCIVLQQKPSQAWVEDYLLHDRNILMCWLADEVRIECPEECHDILASIGVVI